MMKRRFLILVLCTAMFLTLAACGKKDPTSNDTPSPTESVVTETPTENPTEAPESPVELALKNAPGDYDFAVEVSINPDFLLYVKGREVVAYKALNEDAKKIEDRCAIVGRGIDGAVEDIVRSSKDEGYLKEGGTVNMTVVRANCAKSQADEVMRVAEETVQRTSQECGVQVQADVRVENDVAFAPEPNGEPEPGQSEPRKDEGCSVCCGTGVCERCDGTGVVECIACQGTGTIPRNCWKCKGSGKDENGNTCPECNGVGNHGEETCGDCNGSGRCECEQCHGSKKCPACGGTGQKPDD